MERWIITIIIIMITLTYLNQEVPACIDNPTVQSNVTLNYSIPEVNNISHQLDSNILVFNTAGTSMLPLIKDNQRCACIKSATYSVGDIVVYFADFGQGFEGIAHKIINIENESIITKGINNNQSDNPIKQENILCRIPSVPRYKLF